MFLHMLAFVFYVVPVLPGISFIVLQEIWDSVNRWACRPTEVQECAGELFSHAS